MLSFACRNEFNWFNEERSTLNCIAIYENEVETERWVGRDFYSMTLRRRISCDRSHIGPVRFVVFTG